MIHIVEDDASVRDAITLLFQEVGVDSTAYADGESLLNNPSLSSDDTIIIDLKLPGISGEQLIQHLRSLKYPPQIVAITGQRISEINQFLRIPKRPPLVRKPLKAEDLFSEIQLPIDVCVN